MPKKTLTPEEYAIWKLEQIRSLATRLIAISSGHQLDLADKIYWQCDNVLLGIKDLTKSNEPTEYFYLRDDLDQ